MLSGNISRNSGGALCFAGHDTAKLAEKYGTPLYLMDEGAHQGQLPHVPPCV